MLFSILVWRNRAALGTAGLRRAGTHRCYQMTGAHEQDPGVRPGRYPVAQTDQLPTRYSAEATWVTAAAATSQNITVVLTVLSCVIQFTHYL